MDKETVSYINNRCLYGTSLYPADDDHLSILPIHTINIQDCNAVHKRIPLPCHPFFPSQKTTKKIIRKRRGKIQKRRVINDYRVISPERNQSLSTYQSLLTFLFDFIQLPIPHPICSTNRNTHLQ
jgi:hypothetical protein